MKYYKITTGYKRDEYIPILGDELPKALALFVEGNGRGVFEAGAVRGQDIRTIEPDWHRIMGWNKGYEMTPEDYNEIKPLETEYRNTTQVAKQIVEYAMKNNRKDLLLKPASEVIKEMPELMESKKLNVLSEATKQLADKFSK